MYSLSCTTKLGTANEDEHLESLNTISDMFYESGVIQKHLKCDYGVRRAEILGHIVDKDGLRPSENHVEGIRTL